MQPTILSCAEVSGSGMWVVSGSGFGALSHNPSTPNPKACFQCSGMESSGLGVDLYEPKPGCTKTPGHEKPNLLVLSRE